jgi:hypothetical protein
MSTHTGKNCQTSKPLHALRHRRHGGGGGALGGRVGVRGGGSGGCGGQVAVHDNRQFRPHADVALLERVVALERPAVAREVKHGRARCVPSFRHHLHDAALGVVNCAVNRQLTRAAAIVHAETQMQARTGARSAVRDHRRGRDENADGHYVEGYGEGVED